MAETFYFHGVGGLQRAWDVWNDPSLVHGRKCCNHGEATLVGKFPRRTGTHAEDEVIRNGTNIEVYILCEHCKGSSSHYDSPLIEWKPITPLHIDFRVTT
jgi:hypothetical protein